MDIELLKEVPVEAYETIMNVGIKSDEHKFYLRILELTKELGYLTYRMLNENLLFRDSENVIGKRIIEVLEGYGLIREEIIKENEYNLVGNESQFISNFLEKSILWKHRELKNIFKNKGFITQNISTNNFIPFEFTPKGKSFIKSNWPKSCTLESEKELFELLTENGLIQKKLSEKLVYKLTPLGQEALDTSTVLIPEEDNFVINTTSDPLFPEVIIGYEKPENNSHEEYYNTIFNKTENNENQKKLVKPKWLEVYLKKLKQKPITIKLAAKEYEEIQINTISQELYPVKPKIQVSTRIIISSFKNPEMFVKTTQKNRKKLSKEVKVESSFNLPNLKILEKMYENQIQNIETISGESTLLVSFDELKSSEKSSFTRDFSKSKLEIEGYGTFGSVSIRGLKLFPKTINDAVLWIKWIIEEEITGYINEQKYQNILDECVNKFSEKYSPIQLEKMMPTFEEFANKCTQNKENPKLYWYIIAPKFLTVR